MIIFAIFSVSVSAGLAMGLFLLRALAVVLVSPCVALLSAAILFYHGFGLLRSGSISFGSIAALQSSYMVGLWIRLSGAPALSKIFQRAARRARAAARYPSTAVGEDGGFREREATVAVADRRRPPTIRS